MDITGGAVGPSGGAIIVDAHEVERLVENLKPHKIGDIGSDSWVAQHRVLEQLNLQAHQNAVANAEEFVTESLLTFEKLPVLVHELLAVEAWRESVYPKIKDALAARNSMRGYFMFYQEAVIVNLLEVVMYYDYAVEAMGDCIVDLLDYICRRVVWLAGVGVRAQHAKPAPAKSAKEVYAEMEASTPSQDLDKRAEELAFKSGIVCVTLLRYLTEHVKKLPLSAINRVLDTHDVMVMIVPLIENPPWTRMTADRTWQKYKEGKWEDVAPEDLLRLTKHEGQPWLILFNLMCDADCRNKYYFNSHRKATVLRVRKYLNELLLDQLPVLADVQRYMDELTVMEAPAPTAQSRGFVLEVEPEIRTALLRDANWDEIAAYQLAKIPKAQNDREITKLADVYANDAFDDLLGEAKCFECGKPAIKRCSKCRNAWYCSRKCQVRNWKAHKKVCDIISEAEKSDAKAAKAAAKAATAAAGAGAGVAASGAGVAAGDSNAGAGAGAAMSAAEVAEKVRASEGPRPAKRVLVEEVVE